MRCIDQDSDILKKIYQEIIELREDINELKSHFIREENPTEEELEDILSGLQDTKQGKIVPWVKVKSKLD